MKSLVKYILEYKTNDEIKIIDGTKEINPQRFAYDGESLGEFINYFNNNSGEAKNGTFKLCEYQNNKWKTIAGAGKFNFLRPDTNEYYIQGNLRLSFEELNNNIECGKYILILV